MINNLTTKIIFSNNSRLYHHAYHIDAAIDELKRGLNWLEPMTPQKAMLELCNARNQGLKYYPGPNCDNYGESGKCMGHKIKD